MRKPGHQLVSGAWHVLVLAQYQRPARQQPRDDSVQRLALSGRVEVGEDQVATEDQMERTLGSGLPNVLLDQFHIVSELGAQAVLLSGMPESRGDAVR